RLGYGFLHCLQLQGGLVPLAALPHLRYPQRIRVRWVPGDDVTKATGHLAHTVEHGLQQLLASALYREHLADKSVHVGPFLSTTVGALGMRIRPFERSVSLTRSLGGT